ncbi:MAG: LON peptidase substrate-binding domain-containing protein [Pseudomonadales bacterium]|nr:LON peptidase substrate-binding domain-containing protein [Pseudomonadales bacterium]MCP5329665.1 LON peptidase substrate-binding domain-containing protein [Pseudomonadales bacterium]MCP5343796.1 LON peptidase substrate-binding domain-containing protein [Pseudomonadales bacterium]
MTTSTTQSANGSEDTIALFPLKSVLFPKGRLPLQIFEQRYLNLVTHCLRSNTGFGVCLLREGEEVMRPGTHQQVHRTGTLARIVDWDQLPNGLLGITVEGERKFEVEDCHYDERQWLMARVRYSATDYAGEAPLEVDDEQEALVDLVEQLVSHPVINRLGMNIAYHDLRELGWRLSELVPLSLERKQALLELDDPYQRIRDIEALLHRLMDES